MSVIEADSGHSSPKLLSENSSNYLLTASTSSGYGDFNNQRKTRSHNQDTPKSPEPEMPYTSFTYSKEQSMRYMIPTDYCHRVTLRKLSKPVSSWFSPIQVLGTGAYGRVILVRKTNGDDNQKLYAMKSIHKRNRKHISEKLIEHLKTERQILELIRDCPFLVHLHYAFQTETELNLVLDYVPGGELFTLIDKKGRLSDKTARFYIGEIILALEQLHKRRIIYRDLKLENVLIDAEGHIVLTDFGLCKHFAKNVLIRTKSYCGTTEYMAPELLNGTTSGYGFSVDWWTVGVLLYELITSSTPFGSDTKKSEDTKYRILNTHPEIPDFVHSSTKSLILKLLKKKPEDRLGCGPNGVKEIKSHRYFDHIDWDKLYKKEYKVPYTPQIEHELDTSNFSAEFTNLSIHDCDNREQTDDNLYRNYSYVSPSFVCLNKLTDLPRLTFTNSQMEHCTKFLSKYSLDRILLGSGCFGITHRCTSKVSRLQCAVKVFTKTDQNYLEIEILRSFQHPNIVSFIDHFEAKSQHFLVMESLEGGELFDRAPLNEKDTRVIFTKIVSAVSYIHACGVIHGDIKLENIMLVNRSETAEPKIIDFGFATYANSPRNSLIIPYTREYVPPEFLKEVPEQSFASDIWSLGISFCLLLSGVHPFMFNKQSVECNVLTKAPRFPKNEWNDYSEDAKDLAKSMLKFKMELRPTANEILKQPWMLDINSRKRPSTIPLRRSKRLMARQNSATSPSNITS